MKHFVFMQIYIDDMVLFWLRAIVELRDNIASQEKILREESRQFKTFLELMLCRVRDVANNMISHLIFFLEAKKSLLTQFVREYWDAARRGSEINWRHSPTSSHVFLGLFYLLMNHVRVVTLCLQTY